MDRHAEIEPQEVAAKAARLRLLADETPEYASFMLSADGQIDSWSIGATRLYGYLADEVLGQQVSCLYSREDAKRGKPDEELKRAAAEGRFEAEGWRVRWDGSRYWANVVTVAVRDPTGILRGFLQETRNITERKRAEDSANALAEVGCLLAKSLNVAEIGQRIADEIRGLLGSENAALYGLEPGSSDLVTLAVSGEMKSDLGRLVLTQGIGAPSLAVRDGRAVVMRDILTDPRITLTIEARLSVIHAPHRAMLAVPLRIRDRVIGALGILDWAGRAFDEREVRLAQAFADQAALGLETSRLYQESVRAYEELLRAQEQLARAQKIETAGRLAGGVAHDFNNLLTVIIASCQVMSSRLSPDDPARRDIELIDKAAKGAAELTGQLLAFGRKQSVRPAVFDVNLTVESLGPMLRRLMGESVEVVMQLEAAPALVRADPGKIEQVLVNLALNARDAMPDGGRLVIETSTVDLSQTGARRGSETPVSPGPCVMLTVRDTGTGMDAQVLARAFEPFFTTKAPGRGTGLGLSVVYGIVKQGGGDIALESEPGKGTSFKVWLPRAVESTTDSLTASAVSTQSQRGDETILLVEDDEKLRSALCAGLQANGYRVLAARDGREALEVCEGYTDRVHMLVVDVVLPLFNGCELANLLLGTRPNLKVLFMSGYTADNAIPNGLLTSGMSFLEKPFTLGALLAKIREMLGTRESEHQA